MTTNYTFDDTKEVKPNYFKFGKVGDGIIGTLTTRKIGPSPYPDKKGEIVSSYQVKAKSKTQFHRMDDKNNPVLTEIPEGSSCE